MQAKILTEEQRQLHQKTQRHYELIMNTAREYMVHQDQKKIRYHFSSFMGFILQYIFNRKKQIAKRDRWQQLQETVCDKLIADIITKLDVKDDEKEALHRYTRKKEDSSFINMVFIIVCCVVGEGVIIAFNRSHLNLLIYSIVIIISVIVVILVVVQNIFVNKLIREAIRRFCLQPKEKTN